MHRMSIPIGDNEFLTEQPNGKIYSTAMERMVQPGSLSVELCTAIDLHRKTGYSESCVICKTLKEADPDNAMLKARAAQLTDTLTNEQLTMAEASEYYDELIAIQNRLQLDGDALSDFGDARREVLEHGRPL